MRQEQPYKKKKISIKISELSRKKPYQVPDGYFEGLPDSISNRITEETINKKTIAFTPGLNWQTSLIAATLTLLAVFYSTFQPVVVEEDPQQILAEVSIDDILEYLDYADLTTSEILAEVNFEETEIDDFIENDIQLLNSTEIESLDIDELYHEFGLEDGKY